MAVEDAHKGGVGVEGAGQVVLQFCQRGEVPLDMDGGMKLSAGDLLL